MTDYAVPSLTGLLDAAERQFLESLGQRITYADGALLHSRGDLDSPMGVVVQGTVKILRDSSDGRQVLMLTVNKGQNFGDHNALNKCRRTHHGVAVGKTVVDYYPHDVLLQLLDNPGITRALYKIAAFRLGQTVELFDDIRSMSPEVRLAKMLSTIRASSGGASRLDCVQEDLASLMGVSAMTLSKALKSLKAERLIDTGYRTITILDHQRFDGWLEERIRY